MWSRPSAGVLAATLVVLLAAGPSPTAAVPGGKGGGKPGGGGGDDGGGGGGGGGGGKGKDRTPPQPPTDLAVVVATLTPFSVELTWTAPPDADLASYDIYRDLTRIGSSTTTGFVDDTVHPDTAYGYTVHAVDASGNVSDPGEVAVVTPSATGPYVLRGGTVIIGGVAALKDVQIDFDTGKIAAIADPGSLDPALPGCSVVGRFLVPAFIDSHVHVDYRQRTAELARGGIQAAIDWACRESFFGTSTAPVDVRLSGPMLVETGGYTIGTGYSHYIADSEAAARGGVDHLAGLGAQVIKLPVTGAPQLGDASLAAAVDQAHSVHGLKVGSHALGDAYSARAFAAGVDVLVHVPTELMSDANIDAWATRTVITTADAFSGSARANVTALHGRGARILYGTDFGNPTAVYDGIDPDEIATLALAGLSPAEIIASGTSVPAAYWGFADLGEIAVGKAASILVLTEDPLDTVKIATALATPEKVFLRGVLQ